MGRTTRERNKAVVESLTLQAMSDDEGKRADAIRKSAQQFAKVVVKNTEDGPEATLSQRHIEQAVFYAVRSIIFNKPVEITGDMLVDAPKKRGGRPRKVQPQLQPTVKRARRRTQANADA